MQDFDSAAVVIVGAGQAGGRAAETLRASGFKGAITMIGGEAHLPYERPQLSKSILLDQSAVPTYLRSSEEWAALDVGILTGVDAIGCDPDKRLIGLADGREVRFDKLLLATGTRARRLPSLEGGALPVHYLRAMDDALSLRPLLREGARIVLVGGGVIGLEVAAAAVERGCSVTVVEAMPNLLAQVGSAVIGAYFAKLHRDRGVNILTGVTAVRTVQGAVELSDGSLCPADLVVVGVGVEPVTDLAAPFGISSPQGIRVDGNGATEVEGIYAAGDVALQWDRCSNRWTRIENWANAQNQASATAKSMLGQGGAYDAAPWFWSDQYKVNLQVVGSLAEVEEVVRGDVASGRFSVVGLRDGEVVGAATVNSPKDMALLRRIVAARRRLIKGDLENPEFDLRRAI